MIDITPGNLEDLRRLRKDALRARQTRFTYMGHEINTAYAKYVIEYMEDVLKFRQMKKQYEDSTKGGSSVDSSIRNVADSGDSKEPRPSDN